MAHHTVLLFSHSISFRVFPMWLHVDLVPLYWLLCDLPLNESVVIRHRLSICSFDEQSISKFEFLSAMLLWPSSCHPIVVTCAWVSGGHRPFSGGTDGRRRAFPDVTSCPPRIAHFHPMSRTEFSALLPGPAL